ncbi:hypothetical protein [Stenotrophomonas sp. S41]|uniref:hypothetical protein n=1 Tax=Stenotrophomonas sp. S41 TaxID=2767464 RepID=UPI001F2A0BF5|nr:hypothetical protein [Stenotrophomonas sp. S41]
MADHLASVAMTKDELNILQHSLGLDQHGRGDSRRNHFVTSEGSVDHRHCMALFNRGLMTRTVGFALAGGSDVFTVTGAGREAVKAYSPAPPKLTRSQQRYQQFLRYDGGVTFGEYLRGWR